MQMVASGLAGQSIMQCNSFPVVQARLARMLPARLEQGEQGEIWQQKAAGVAEAVIDCPIVDLSTIVQVL